MKTDKTAPEGGGKPKGRAGAGRRSSPGAHERPKRGRESTEPAEGQAQVVKRLMTTLEQKMSGNQMKATLGDYIRLVQLHKELDDESPTEIKVTWVEPARDKAEETGSGSEE